MSESSTRCVITDNMEERNRQVVAPIENMEASHRRAAPPVVKMEANHRRVVAPAANMRQRARHNGALMVKAWKVRLSSRPAATKAIGVTSWQWWPSTCCTDDIDNHGFKRGISNHNIREVIVGTNIVV
jgi:hypothetical protein